MKYESTLIITVVQCVCCSFLCLCSRTHSLWQPVWNCCYSLYTACRSHSHLRKYVML